MNYIALFRLRGSAGERAARRCTQMQEIASDFLARNGASERLTLLVGIDEPREMDPAREGNDYAPPFDFAVKICFAGDDALRDALQASSLPTQCADWSAYRVEETVKKEREEAWRDGPVPGVHMLHPLYFHEDLPLSTLLRSWRDIHGDLALRVHVGANMYRQHLVQKTVAAGAAPAYGGFSEFHFPSGEALLQGYFDSDRGRMEIRHDIRHFIKGFPPRLFAEEHRCSRASL